MALVAVLAAQERERERLKLAVEELGHRAAAAMDVKSAVELLGADRPRLFVVAQAPSERTAEALIGELEREAPLLPVVVALTERRSWRALELLKAGAFEVVAPPWTAEGLAAVLTKALRFRGTAFSEIRSRSGPRGLLYGALAAAAVFCLAAGGVWLRAQRRLVRLAEEGPPPTSWTLPYSHPSGLAFDGREFWVSDWYARSVYRVDPRSKSVTRSAHLPGETPGALAFGADALWLVSDGSSILKRMLGPEMRPLDSFGSGGERTLCLAYDGLYLWTCDGRSGRLSKRILDGRLTAAESYEYPGGRPAALAFDGKDLWSLDAGNKEILRHDVGRPRRILQRIPLEEYRGGDWEPAGLAFADGALWTVAQRRPRGQEPGRLFRHPIPASGGAR